MHGPRRLRPHPGQRTRSAARPPTRRHVLQKTLFFGACRPAGLPVTRAPGGQDWPCYERTDLPAEQQTSAFPARDEAGVKYFRSATGDRSEIPVDKYHEELADRNEASSGLSGGRSSGLAADSSG